VSDEFKTLDLSTKTFDEFVKFFFDRIPVPDDEQYKYFLLDLDGETYDEAVPSSPDVLVGYMNKMFLEFGQIATKYSLTQIDQGIWGLLGENLRLYELLWDRSIPLPNRLECIRAMYFVYSDFVAKSEAEVMVNCFDMWWDLISYGFWFQTKLFTAGIKMGEVSKLDAEARALLDQMFETLKRVLELPDQRTQTYALHGLGHLHHPAVRKTVQEFIDNNKAKFTEPDLRWIEECRDGTVM